MRHIKYLYAAMVGISLLFQSNISNAEEYNKKSVIVELKESAIHDTTKYITNDDRIVNNAHDWGYLSQKMFGTMQNLELKHNFKSNQGFDRVFKGFSADLTAQQIADLSNNPAVKNITMDTIVHTTAQTIPWGILTVNANLSSSLAGNNTGVMRGSNVYVLDTKNVKTHSDLFFTKYLTFGYRSQYDCNGHGTNVAGTIAAADNIAGVVGVAPSIPVTAIKILDCNGSGLSSNIIKAIDWVSANGVKPAVINMSLGGDPDPAFDTAVANAVTQGITVVVAAGNSAGDACLSSPARMEY